jgi:phenylalanyl-tRNA synthetase alpha chain
MIPPSIKAKIGRNLHLEDNHPLCIIKYTIVKYLEANCVHESFNPIVSIEDNFDSLLIPKDHVSRNPSDTFYLEAGEGSPYKEDRVLRTHTSAHQNLVLRQMQEYDNKGISCIVGDVYRRDTIDRFHYPIFHQMEGLKFSDDPQQDLKDTLVGLIKHLFGDVEYRIVDSYFPFTDPSWEIEVKLNDVWIEVLGCGQIREEILKNAGSDKKGWAFGLGLERLAMILFKIPDIRYFWTEDRRFLDQFKEGEIKEFVPYSKYPSSYKDIAFWTNDSFNENEFCEQVRECGGDLIEDVRLIDRFSKGDRTSLCYRITYQSFDRTMTNEEINVIQNKIRKYFIDKGMEVR